MVGTRGKKVDVLQLLKSPLRKATKAPNKYEKTEAHTPGHNPVSKSNKTPTNRKSVVHEASVSAQKRTSTRSRTRNENDEDPGPGGGTPTDTGSGKGNLRSGPKGAVFKVESPGKQTKRKAQNELRSGHITKIKQEITEDILYDPVTEDASASMERAKKTTGTRSKAATSTMKKASPNNANDPRAQPEDVKRTCKNSPSGSTVKSSTRSTSTSLQPKSLLDHAVSNTASKVAIIDSQDLGTTGQKRGAPQPSPVTELKNKRRRTSGHAETQCTELGSDEGARADSGSLAATDSIVVKYKSEPIEHTNIVDTKIEDVKPESKETEVMDSRIFSTSQALTGKAAVTDPLHVSLKSENPDDNDPVKTSTTEELLEATNSVLKSRSELEVSQEPEQVVQDSINIISEHLVIMQSENAKQFDDEDRVDVERAAQAYITQQRPQNDASIEGLNSFEVLVQVASQEETAEAEATDQGVTEETVDVTQASGNVAQKSALPLRIIYPHASIIYLTEHTLSLCSDPECRCGLVHCPLCMPGTIGVSSMKTMTKHFELHVKRGLTYGDHHICLCMLGCSEEPHLHCPMCGKVTTASFHHLSVFLMHLTECEHKLIKSADTLSALGQDTTMATKSDAADMTPPSALIIPHTSIIKEGDEIKSFPCSPSNGCDCGFYHCPLCPLDRATFRFKSRAPPHLEYHMKHSISFQEYRILICQLSCAMFSHYHCPTCGNIFRRKIDASRHVLSSCKGVNRKRRMRKNLLTNDVGLDKGKNTWSERSSDVLSSPFYSKTQEEEKSTQESEVAELEVDFPHKSIVRKEDRLQPQQCTKQTQPTCNCSLYHCSLCVLKNVKNTGFELAKDHIFTHYKRALPFRDHMVLPCGLGCIKHKKKGFHYHCPNCGITIVVLEQFKLHLYKNCKTSRCYTDNVYTNPSAYSRLKGNSGFNKEEGLRGSVELDTMHEEGEYILEEVVPEDDVQTIVTEAESAEEPRQSIKKSTEDTQSDRASSVSSFETSSDRALSTTTVKAEPEISSSNQLESLGAIVKHENREVEVTSGTALESKTLPPLQILQSVSAEVNRLQLSAIRAVSPEALLAVLHRHTSIRWTPHDDDNFTLSGTWKQLENASSILNSLISNPLNTEEEVYNYIKENGLVGQVAPTPHHAVSTHNMASSAPDPAESTLPMQIDVQADGVSEQTVFATEEYAREVPIVEVAMLTPNLDTVQDNSLQNAIDTSVSMTSAVVCFTCKKTFVNLKSLILHLINIAACRQENSDVCLPPAFQCVVEAVQAVTTLQCPLCKRKFLQKVHCVSHYLKKTCSKNWLNRKILDYNIKRDPLAQLFTCPSCLYSTQNKLAIVNHFEQLHSALSFHCSWPGCKKTYGSQQCLDDHIGRRHINAERVVCPVCGVSILKVAVTNHMISKHSTVSEMPVKRCSQCSYTSWCQTNVQNHFQNVHAEKRYQCKLCDRMYGREVKLKQHMKAVHIKPAFTYQKSIVHCPQCNMKLYQRSLVKHIRTVHEKIKEFTCKKCDKTFSTKKACWSHSLTHLVNSDNERVYLYRCAVCLRGFNRKWWFTEHVKYAHSNDKKYVCSICSKSFRFKLLYERHMLVHEDVSTQCDLCHEVFSETQVLRAHLVSRHNIKSVVSCPCGLDFASMEGFRIHESRCDKYQDIQRSLSNDDVELMINAPKEAQDHTIEEILVSDGIQYDATVVDENGVVLPYMTYETQEAVECIAPQHLEAAQTLESIASLKADDETKADVVEDREQVLVTTEELLGHPDAETIIVKNEEGDQFVAVEDLRSILMQNTMSQAYEQVAVIEDPDEDPRTETIVLQTDTGQEVTLVMPEGHTLSEEDTKNIVLEMSSIQQERLQQNYDTENSEIKQEILNDTLEVVEDQQAFVMYVDENGVEQAAEEEDMLQDNGFMCGMCSEIYSSLEQVEVHIQEVHAQEVPQE